MKKTYKKKKKIIKKKIVKNGFIERFKNVTFKFSLFHDSHNSQRGVLVKNHLNYLKDSIFECFFKKYFLFFKKTLDLFKKIYHFPNIRWNI